MANQPVVSSRHPALVLGAGVTALGVVRCLGRAGIPVWCASRELGFTGVSRWCRRTPERLPRYAPLAPFLSRLPFEHAVLFACSDDWLRAVAELDPALRECFPACQPPWANLEHFVDKGNFAALLGKLKVPHPQTVSVTAEEVLTDSALGDIRGYFLKPRNSQAFSARFHVKAFHIHSQQDAIDYVCRLRQDNLEVMLQELIPGPASNHYFIDGFIDRQGRLLTRMARRRLRMFPREFGNSSLMVTIPLEEISPAADSLQRVLTAADYRGVFSAEFKFDPRDGEYKLLEVNVRPWWYIEFMAQCGINVALMAYRDALGEEITPELAYAVGEYCIYPSLDLNTWLRELDDQEFNPFLWLRDLFTARPVVFRWTDPLPAVIGAGSGLIQVIGRLFGRRQRSHR